MEIKVGPKFTEKHPKLAKFLDDKLPDAAALVGSILPNSGVLGMVKNIIEKATNLSPEEKTEGLALANKAEELHLEEERIANANTANARAMAISIGGEKPSWLAKNVGYLLDIFVALIWGFLTVYLIVRFLQILNGQHANVSDTAIMAMWGAVSAQFGTVMNFHRGASSSSRQKDNIIQSIAMQP